MAPSPEDLRARMVERIGEQLGLALDSPIADAMRRVPRDRFLDDVADADTIHDIHRAVAVPGFDPERFTTSVSAPGLVAWMLHELRLAPGMRVLEVGAGRGYNAALLAELGCDVTTVDIDETLIEPTRHRLADLGYGPSSEKHIVVIHGDGDVGVPDRAPFDRIVATVGCNDLAPAWFDQLAPDGFMVVPVRHGHSHPVVRATPDHRSTFLGHSGFVAILGTQSRTVAAGEELGDLLGLRSEWVPKGTGAGPWVIPRVHHDQVMLA